MHHFIMLTCNAKFQRPNWFPLYLYFQTMLSVFDKEFVRWCLRRVSFDKELFGTIISPEVPSKADFGVLIWDPIKKYGCNLQCPIHHPSLKHTNSYTDDSVKGQSPRLVYDFDRGVLLVSARYFCSACEMYYLSHNELITSQLSADQEAPFLLFHQASITKTAFHQLSSLVTLGNVCNIMDN